MTKVKNIDGFPEAKEENKGLMMTILYNRRFNQARNEIGELDITFDIEKITRLLQRKSMQTLGYATSDTEKYRKLATALAKGDIIKGVSK